MRGFRVMFVMAALCCAARAEASLPPSQCVEWRWVLADGGLPPTGLMGDPEIDVAVEPADGGGTEVPPPPRMRKVCVRLGWPDEEYGCSVGGGVPAVSGVLAALVLVARRARRKAR